ncbi:MAG: neuA1 [Parcubacteria group bacterium]|nr:neuA1 [Parcubacteria group bacterium]
METYGIIIARGGSKRIPGKNVKMFCGKPLMAWTIEEAKKVSGMSRILVSTDDVEIARVAKEFGAEVPFMRPAELAQDLTPDLPVFLHLLDWLEEHEGKLPDALAHLRSTGPLRRAEDMEKGIELLSSHPDYDSIRAVIPTPLHPLKTYRLEGDTLLPYIPDEVSGIHEPYNAPVQSLPKAYASAGYFSVIRTSTLRDQNSMTGEKILGYVCEAGNATDIDTPFDFMIAEARMRERLETSKI